jgi:hypothetical protein
MAMRFADDGECCASHGAGDKGEIVDMGQATMALLPEVAELR